MHRTILLIAFSWARHGYPSNPRDHATCLPFGFGRQGVQYRHELAM